MFVVHCGQGEQKVRWLADTAVHRYDPDYCWDVASVADIRVRGGAQLNLARTVSEALKPDEHVIVQLLGKWVSEGELCLKMCVVE